MKIEDEQRAVKITFGIQPEHLELIEKEIKNWDVDAVNSDWMLYSESFWKKIGEKIGWLPFTISLHYFNYLNKHSVVPPPSSFTKESEVVELMEWIDESDIILFAENIRVGNKKWWSNKNESLLTTIELIELFKNRNNE